MNTIGVDYGQISIINTMKRKKEEQINRKGHSIFKPVQTCRPIYLPMLLYQYTSKLFVQMDQI